MNTLCDDNAMKQLAQRSSGTTFGQAVGLSGLIIILLCGGCSKHLTDEEIKAAAKSQAEQLAAATLAKDFAKVTDLTHPKILAGLGGREEMIAKMQSDDKEAEAQGFRLRAVRMGAPQQLTPAGSQYFVILSELVEMSAPGGKMKVESYVLGVSDNEGRNWTFLDGAGISQAGTRLKQILPNLPSSILLPKKPEPVFEPGG